MDLRQAFHVGKVEGQELRSGESPADLQNMQQEVRDFIDILRTLKKDDGKDAFHIADRDFIKDHDSYVIWANGFSSSMTISIKNEQPFVTFESKIRDYDDKNQEFDNKLLESGVALTASDAIEEICRFIGRAAPELESTFDDTFEHYDFYDVAAP